VNLGTLLAFLGGGALGVWMQFGTLEKTPLPHFIPPAPGRLPFSFALTQDILHQRYVRGDDAYYRRRNQSSLARLPANFNLPLQPAHWPAVDDLAAGFDRLHQSERGIPWLRAKLASQQQANLPLSERYTTLANLGTLLIHQHMPGLMGGDGDSEAGVREGLGYIEHSIQANPEAHFGREVWQAEAVRTLLKMVREPALKTQQDILGNPLRTALPEWGVACTQPTEWAAFAPKWLKRPEQDLNAAERRSARSYIPKAGEVAFDEPALGLLGMWWYGGGPNPHLALALAGLMEDAGQLPLAWVAYQRTREMSDRLWKDPAQRQSLLDHCVMRQRKLEQVIQEEHPLALEADYQRELAQGLAYQKQHSDPTATPNEVRPPLASDYAYTRRDVPWHWKFLAFGLLAAGIYRRSFG